MADFTDADVPDQSGRTMLVTGANTGIGFETAKALAEQGARVLLGCRSEDRATDAIARIHLEVGEADLAFVPLDQGDLSSVAAAADRVQEEERLDVLVNNAGIMMPPRELTTDGFESQFGVNHLGTFALTSQLLPKLAETEGSRVVITSSIAHRAGNIHFDDIDASKNYGAQDRYQQSKLANLLFMYELDRRLRAVESTTIAVGCHPGIADTELSRHLPKLLMLAAPMLKIFFNSSAEGAWPTLMAATADEIEGGDYTGPSKRGETAGPARKVPSTGRARDPQLANLLWDLSIEMTGVDPGI
ncbi:oxidoreductase [Ilumatobacter nonamiensis]|uniref:oxidoreductase n=1 Tax=Ilumatobacter nonamiensis TaxID=467093 RepID=UPI00034CE4B8|nr:oxidoreductase [Ilumatobacter nonamiensis]